MLGLDYSSSDSEGEGQQRQKAMEFQQQATRPPGGSGGGPAAGAGPPARAAGAAAAGPVSGLPSAAELLGGTGLAPSIRLPLPDFGQPAVGVAGGRVGTGKRSHPDTRGPMPNLMSQDHKLQRSGGSSVGGAKPSAPGSALLPPQLRGRANVSTEDLSTMFTKRSQLAAQQRSSSSGGSGGSGGGPRAPS